MSDHLSAEDERELTTELARLAAVEAAPDELPVFDLTASDYWTDPESVLEGGRGEQVGFGLNAALVTPLLLSMAMPVVKYLADQIGGAVKESAGPRIRTLLRRLLRLEEPDEQAPAPSLTPEQVGRVRKIAEEQASVLGVPADRAALLADAIAGRVLAGT